MTKRKNSIPVILDLSKGLGYGFLYQPVIGTKSKEKYPSLVRFPSPYRKFAKRSSS